jgi:hypothetical protein
MARITVTVSDERYAALKEAAARRRQTIGRLVDDALEFYGLKSTAEAATLVARARRAAAMSEDEALQLAVRETRAGRQR